MHFLNRIVARIEGAGEEGEAVEAVVVLVVLVVLAVGVAVVAGETVNLLQPGLGKLRQGRRENVR